MASGLGCRTFWVNDGIIGQCVTDGEYCLLEPWLERQSFVVIAKEEGRSPNRVSLIREVPAEIHSANIELLLG